MVIFNLSEGVQCITFAIMVAKIAVLIACLYTKSAELLKFWVKFILWSKEPYLEIMFSTREERVSGSFCC